MVNNTVTLDRDRQQIIDTIADEQNDSKADVFRKIVDIAAKADDLEEMDEAIDSYQTVTLTEYDPIRDADSNIEFSRAQLGRIDELQPINPDHVSKKNMPQAHGDKILVIACMMLFNGHLSVDIGDDVDGSYLNLKQYVARYVGVSHTLQEDGNYEKWTDMMDTVIEVYGADDAVENWNQYRKFRDADNIDLETAHRLLDNDAPQTRALRMFVRSQTGDQE